MNTTNLYIKKQYALKIILVFIGIVIGFLISNHRYIFLQFKKSTIFTIESISHKKIDFTLIEISSSYDDKMQKAYFYPTASADKMPLIVSLHPWSSDYTYIENQSSLAGLAINEDWNFIYPDFRGANVSPEACLSEAVIQDIDDAIGYAIKNGNVDERKIVVVGLSGGGMATLGVYLQSSYDLYYCMAWCPVSDLETWYYQSKYMGTKYWGDIQISTNSDVFLNVKEAQKRSPVYAAPLLSRNNTYLEIYAGINDGYTGSVPISHSILFYNKMIKYYGDIENTVSDSEIIDLLSRTVRNNTYEYIGDRKIIYKKISGTISLCIFDGTHEMLPEYAFSRVKEIVWIP